MKVRVHCEGFGAFRTDDAAAGATSEDVMMLVERAPSNRDVHYTMASWLLCLATLAGLRAGDPLPLGYNFSDAAASTGPDGVLNVWVEPKPGTAAGEPWGPGSWAGGGLGAGLG